MTNYCHPPETTSASLGPHVTNPQVILHPLLHTDVTTVTVTVTGPPPADDDDGSSRATDYSPRESVAATAAAPGVI